LWFLLDAHSIKPGGPIKEEEQVSVLTGKAGGWVISDLGSKKNPPLRFQSTPSPGVPLLIPRRYFH
jgi:hypothetical protein